MEYSPLEDNSLTLTSEGGENNRSPPTSNNTGGQDPSKNSKNTRQVRTLKNSGSDLAEPLTTNFAVENGNFEIGDIENGEADGINGNRVADDDPYYVFKDDLHRKLGIVDESLSNYIRVIKNTDTAVNTHEIKDVKKQLKRHLKHSESTLKDLQTTIRLVEKQRSKFSNISDAELSERKAFVTQAQTRIARAKQEMNSDDIKEKIVADERALATRRAGNSNPQTEQEKENTAFLINNSTQAQLMLRQQDETLDELDDAVVRVGNMADIMHSEINSQNKMLDDLEDDLQNAEEQLGVVMGKLGKFLKTKNRCQIGTILTLCLIVVVLFFLVVYS